MVKSVKHFGLVAGLLGIFFLPTQVMPDVPPVFVDNMEHGSPSTNGWYFFDGAVGSGGIAANSSDLPPKKSGLFSLTSGWGSGSTPGYYGGFGVSKSLNLSNQDHFNFWINPDIGQSYTLEINLQDDDNADGVIDGTNDDEFQFDCVVSASGPCAISGGGWQQVSIPLADFSDDSSNLAGGNDILDAVPVSNGGNGQLLEVIVAVIGTGTDVDFRTDNWVFSDGSLAVIQTIDDFESALPVGADGNGLDIGFYTFASSSSTISLTRTNSPSAQVPDAISGNQVLQVDVNSFSFAGLIHAFENPGLDTWVTQNWSTSVGLRFWFYGQNSGTTLFLDLLDNRNPGSSSDDAERFSVDFTDDFNGWQLLEFPFVTFSRKEIGNGAPNDGLSLADVHGWTLGALGTGGLALTYYVDDVELYGEVPLPDLDIGFLASSSTIAEGEAELVVVSLNRALGDGDPSQVTVDFTSEPNTATPGRDYSAVSGTLTFVKGESTKLTFSLQTFDDDKWQGNRSVNLLLSDAVGADISFLSLKTAVIEDDEIFDPNLINDFEMPLGIWTTSNNLTLSIREITPFDVDAQPGQADLESVLQVSAASDPSASFFQEFAKDQDWSTEDALNFWYFGSGSGDTVTVQIKDNRASDPGPSEWELVWSDEFNDPAGTSPNPENWSHDIGSVGPGGEDGWGNSELQYYTADTDNAATDGIGNLLLTARTDSGSLSCWYGPCEYTSARLTTKHKAEFAYGRIEARINYPSSEGLYSRFWALGTDFDRVGWPQTGEISIADQVGRLPNEAFGTLHGPGYSGGASFGGIYDFGEPIANDYHVLSIEWEPDAVRWYVDGILYHLAIPADVAPNEWVFNDPVFLLLNVAVGGNFAGTVDPAISLPESMAVDYVRVYQAPDSAERFETSFVDNLAGWQRVSLPFANFVRSAEQPAGAPDDGLGLNEVWGFGLQLSLDDSLFIDQVSVGAVLNLSPIYDSDIEATTVVIGETFSFDLDEFFSDPDGDTLTYTIDNASAIPDSLSISGSIVSGTFAPGEDGDYTIQYKACDAEFCVTGEGQLTVNQSASDSETESESGGGGGSLPASMLWLMAFVAAWRWIRRNENSRNV